MRLSTWLIILGTVLAGASVLLIGSLLINSAEPLIIAAEFSLQTISPNADGQDDVTEFSYEISRNATVSLTLTDTEGNVYTFRDRESRAPGKRRVLFSGIVNGYTVSGETIYGEVITRLLADGEYTWTFRVEADDNDEIAERIGTLIIEGADTKLPDITEFTIAPEIFTPNQDGIDDRVQVNVFIEKDAALTLYLIDDQGERSFIPARDGCRENNEAGRHCFDYDGGVTGGADPPANGTYTVIAEAQDLEGQRIRRTGILTIVDGGVPLAEIAAQSSGASVVFTDRPYDDRYYTDATVKGDLVDLPDRPDDFTELPLTMVLGDLLVFRLTVANYGDAPLRTPGGPWPGTVYQQTQTRGAMGRYEESGAWTVGIQCETSTEPYPWRWAIGTPEALYTMDDPRTLNTYYYLAPGDQAVVWGAIRMTELRETRNPQACWAGLIHEDVAISVLNQNVGRREIELIEVAESSSAADN
jgi:hypothetical protein